MDKGGNYKHSISDKGDNSTAGPIWQYTQLCINMS